MNQQLHFYQSSEELNELNSTQQTMNVWNGPNRQVQMMNKETLPRASSPRADLEE